MNPHAVSLQFQSLRAIAIAPPTIDEILVSVSHEIVSFQGTSAMFPDWKLIDGFNARKK